MDGAPVSFLGLQAVRVAKGKTRFLMGKAGFEPT